MTHKNPISEEAAQWAVRLHGGALDEEEKRELDAWVAADPRHEGALVRARAGWVHLDRLAALSKGRSRPTPMDPARITLRVTRRWLLAASVAAATLLGAFWFTHYPAGETYVSGVGELRKVALTDGSTMILNTATQAKVSFAMSRRHVLLLTGEALFEVAKDATRPFVVQAGDLTVTAVGTAFAVRKDDARVDVTVTEGVVELRRDDAPPSAIPQRVAANQRAVLTSTVSLQIEQAQHQESERRLAWRTGMVAFDSEPLSSAIAELNRYSHQQIVVDDAALGARPITGVYRTSDVEGFAQAAAAALGADAVYDGHSIHLRSR